jgi:hypothetical protein
MIVTYSLTWYQSIRFSSRTLQLRALIRRCRLCRPRFPIFLFVCISLLGQIPLVSIDPVPFQARSRRLDSGRWSSPWARFRLPPVKIRSLPTDSCHRLLLGPLAAACCPARVGCQGCFLQGRALLPAHVAWSVLLARPSRQVGRSSPALLGPRLPRVGWRCPCLPRGRVQTSQVLLSDPKR